MDNIKANVHSDDWRHDVDFNAIDWFRHATDQEILDLARCDWQYDLPADRVAKHFEDTHPSISALMEHCRKTKGCGFECSVDPEEAFSWVTLHRPHLLTLIQNPQV